MNHSKKGSKELPLARRIGLPLLTLLTLLTFYGLGTMLGAGIYVLVGKVAASAGMLTPSCFHYRGNHRVFYRPKLLSTGCPLPSKRRRSMLCGAWL